MGKGAHNIFQDLGAKVLAIVAGKPAPQHTDETPVVQPFRIIHQDEARRLQNRFLQWCDEQAVLNPRLVEQTSPKLRERAGHIQEVTPKFADYQPRNGSWVSDGHGGWHWNPAQRTTGGIQQVQAPHTPIPETAQSRKEAERVQKFDPSQLPDWVKALQNGSLLIPGQESASGEQKDAMLMTLRPGSVSEPLPKIDINSNTLASVQARSRSQPLDIPDRSELPTTPSLNKIIEQALPPFIGGGEMPDVQQEAFPEHSWVNSPMSIETPAWVEPQPSALVPLNKDAIAAQDRIVVPHLDEDDTLHVLRAVKPMKESEEK